MLRIVLSFLSGLILIGFYFFLAGAPRALAAESGPVLAPGDPPLTRDAADASAEVTVFMLKVVANGDADADNLSLERPMLDAWAASLAAEYDGLGPDEQQTLAAMPVLRAALAQAWPQAAASQREAVRDSWRPVAQGWLESSTCDTFIGLANAGLVEPSSANRARYKACDAGDVDNADTDAPAAETASAASTANASTAAASSPSSESPTAAYQRASAGLQASHTMYVNMSNALLENHVGNMNAILNMGPTTDYHYVVSHP